MKFLRQEGKKMCGRYAITLPPEAMREWFRTYGEIPNWPVYYNAAPTTALPVGRQNKGRSAHVGVELRCEHEAPPDMRINYPLGSIVQRIVFTIAATLSLPVLTAGTTTAASSRVPEPEHIIVVVLENHSFNEIFGAGEAPFLDYLATHGAEFTKSFAVAHPSQPNYFALFSGSTQGAKDDRPYSLTAPTLAGSLHAVGKSFVGYVERGSPRKHNPWESFAESDDVEQDMSRFPSDLAQLPTVSFVIPNLDHDMHDGSIAEGDAWLRQHLGHYADWCNGHNSLLIVTFDEPHREGARIPTVFFGAAVRPGVYAEQIDHYSVLRTIEAMYGLSLLGDRTHTTPIADVWVVHE